MKLKVLAVLAALAFAVACGSSSTSTTTTTDTETAAEKIQSATNGYIDIGQDSGLQPCLEGTEATCSCPGGGTLTVEGANLTYSDCKTAGGLAYSGSLTTSDGTSLSGTFTAFGACTDATATNLIVADICNQGSIIATCGGEVTNCYLTLPTSVSVEESVEKSQYCTCSATETSNGGGGSSADAQDKMTTSVSNFTGEIKDSMMAMPSSFSCQGSGQVTISNMTSTFSQCVDSGGATYTGSLTNTGGTLSGTMTTFDQCTDVVFSGAVLTSCTGTLVGTCASTSVICSLTAGQGSLCTCNY